MREQLITKQDLDKDLRRSELSRVIVILPLRPRAWLCACCCCLSHNLDHRCVAVPYLEAPASPWRPPPAEPAGRWSEPSPSSTAIENRHRHFIQQKYPNDMWKSETVDCKGTWATAALCFFISSFMSSWSSSRRDCRSFFSLCSLLLCSSSWDVQRE